MTRDEVLNIANSCGYWSGETVEMNDVGIERFARLVAEREREECAKVVETQEWSWANTSWKKAVKWCASAIRERET